MGCWRLPALSWSVELGREESREWGCRCEQSRRCVYGGLRGLKRAAAGEATLSATTNDIESIHTYTGYRRPWCSSSFTSSTWTATSTTLDASTTPSHTLDTLTPDGPDTTLSTAG